MVYTKYESAEFTGRRERMANDASMLLLKELSKTPEGYEKYISNRPRAFASKVVSWVAQSIVRYHTPAIGNTVEEKRAGDQLERWLIGVMGLANTRIKQSIQPSIEDQIAWAIAWRGWFAGRCMLNKDDDGNTIVEIQPWDPANVVYAARPDGIEWIARKLRLSRANVIKNFGVTPRAFRDGIEDEENSTGVDVIEYMDREVYTVVGGFRDKMDVFVPMEPHRAVDSRNEPAVPAFLGLQGAIPQTQIDGEDFDSADSVGESVVEMLRDIGKTLNRLAGDALTMTSRDAFPPSIFQTPDGEGADMDPWRPREVTTLKQGETLSPALTNRSTQDVQALMGFVAGEEQRGALTDVHYGVQTHQLSGAAIRQLRQSVDDKLSHRINAFQTAQTQIINSLRFQYQTGLYQSFEVSGTRGDFRAYFRETIQPFDLEQAGTVQVLIKQDYGLTDPEKFATARLLIEMNIAPKSWVLENVLDVQDVEEWEMMIAAQNARDQAPKLMLHRMGQSLNREGRPEEALVMQEHLNRLTLHERRSDILSELVFAQQITQLLGGAPGIGGGGGLGGGGGGGGPGGSAPGGAVTGDSLLGPGGGLLTDPSLLHQSALGLEQGGGPNPASAGARAPGQPSSARSTQTDILRRIGLAPVGG